MAAVDDDARRRFRLAVKVLASSVAAAAVLGVVLGGIAILIALTSSETKAQEVAERVAPDVIRQVVQDSRAQRAANARGVLAVANEDLTRLGRPTVADPGPQANAEQILAAASSAQVFSVLPDAVAAQLADEAGGGPIMLPSATVNPPATGGEVVPDSTSPGPGGVPGGSGGAPGPGAPSDGSAPGNPGGNAAPGPGVGGQPAPPGRTVAPPAPQPPAPETRRRLIPPILPLPLPLIGT